MRGSDTDGRIDRAPQLDHSWGVSRPESAFAEPLIGRTAIVVGDPATERTE
jgi:hypothetical protein